MFSVVTNQTGFLPDEGKYTVECLRIEEAPDNGYGIGVRWILALYQDGNRILNDQGFEFEYWQTTSPNMGPKARARAYVEAFLGRPLDDGERINPDDLHGKRCAGMVIHEESKTKPGVQNAKLVSVKPLVSSAPNRNAQRPASQVSADPTADDVDRALLASKLEKKIGLAVKKNSPNHLKFIAVDLKTIDTNEMKMLLNTVQDELDALDD